MACPFCRSKDSCEHLVLSYDATFNTVLGGELYDEIRQLENTLASGIDHAAQKRKRFPRDSAVPERASINGLIKELASKIDPHGDEYDNSVTVLLSGKFYDLLYDEIIGSDKMIYELSEDDEGGPGMSSEMIHYYTPEPEQFRKVVLEWIREIETQMPIN